MNPEIFKAYDVRGRVGSELTVEVCWNIGKALADFLPNDGAVAVGYDMRPDSKQLAEAVIEGVRLQGRDVINIGLVSTDMIYFAVGKLGLAGGAMVTASHNPGDYNGIKLCREEAKPIGIETGLLEIRDAAMAGNFVPAAEKGNLTDKDVREEWVQHVLSFVEVSKWPQYHIAIDAGNGMLGAIAPVLEPHVPLKIERMYFELDGTFPNHIANPLEPKNIIDLQQKIRSEALDFGIAFDGDGDRAVLVDETGEPVSGTVMTAILAKYFLSRHPNATILYNAICGRIVPETVEANSGTAIRTKVGHSYIKAKMREHDAVFAGEHSSHYYFRDNWSADSGLLAAMIAIEVLAQSGKKLSQLAAEFKKYVAIPETNFEVADKTAVLESLKQTFTDGQKDELDGLTVNYSNAWFNVRGSNTEPLIRLNAEATTVDELEELVARVRAVIEKA
ncbi:MAG TPA: phosphomannomutase/phosphoglucomutase [Verrucomicrobiae bacterium]|nr:phosphomannomutase/phosphoglucomutase [Verrucomicrobiae bacterium]